MKALQADKLVAQYRAEVNYHKTQIRDVIKTLPSYSEENGPGYSLGVLLIKLVRWNHRIIVLNKRITQIQLDQEGLFKNLSGKGVQPAQT